MAGATEQAGGLALLKATKFQLQKINKYQIQGSPLGLLGGLVSLQTTTGPSPKPPHAPRESPP